MSRWPLGARGSARATGTPPVPLAGVTVLPGRQLTLPGASPEAETDTGAAEFRPAPPQPTPPEWVGPAQSASLATLAGVAPEPVAFGLLPVQSTGSRRPEPVRLGVPSAGPPIALGSPGIAALPAPAGFGPAAAGPLPVAPPPEVDWMPAEVFAPATALLADPPLEPAPEAVVTGAEEPLAHQVPAPLFFPAPPSFPAPAEVAATPAAEAAEEEASAVEAAEEAAEEAASPASTRARRGPGRLPGRTLALLGVAVVLAGGALAYHELGTPTAPDVAVPPAASEVSANPLSWPQTIGALVRQPATAAPVAPSLAGSSSFGPVSAAAYGLTAAGTTAARLTGAPLRPPTAFPAALRTFAALQLTGATLSVPLTATAPGPHGGVMECGVVRGGSLPAGALCAWGDPRGVVSLVLPGGSLANARDLALVVRSIEEG